MAKAKSIKLAITGPQKAMHSRVSYLYQVAAHLETHQQQLHHRDRQVEIVHPDPEQSVENLQSSPVSKIYPHDDAKNISRRLVSELRSIALKAQLRISPEMKHSICKNCDTLLVNGSTLTSQIENKSKAGKKPWADVLVRKCTICGHETRTPVALQRQKRRPERSLDYAAQKKVEASKGNAI
jgi:ribonuclease P protein subunit RPR2